MIDYSAFLLVPPTPAAAKETRNVPLDHSTSLDHESGLVLAHLDLDTYAANQVDLDAGVFQFLAVLGSDDDGSLDGLTVLVERGLFSSFFAPYLEFDHVAFILAVEADLDVAYGLEECSHWLGLTCRPTGQCEGVQGRLTGGARRETDRIQNGGSCAWVALQADLCPPWLLSWMMHMATCRHLGHCGKVYFQAYLRYIGPPRFLSTMTVLQYSLGAGTAFLTLVGLCISHSHSIH